MHVERMTLYSVPISIASNLTRYGAGQTLHTALHAIILRLDADNGLVGWGEVCSAPPYYLPDVAAGAPEGIRHVAPLILGQDPRQMRALNLRVDQALRGHGNAKTALDMALLDLVAKAAGLPLCDVWGGRVCRSVPVFAVVDIGTPAETAAKLIQYRTMGYSRFQIKVAGAGPESDIATIRTAMGMVLPHERVWFDPNRAWLVDDALRVISAVRELSPMIENPCETYEECRAVAQRTGVPFMLDETIDSLQRFIQGVGEGVIHVASLKLNTFGGLSKLRLVCDLGVELGVPMRIENYGGTGILLAAVTHLAQTLPERNVFGLYDYVRPDLPLVKNSLQVVGGRVGLADNPPPGLGVDIDESLLGEPLAILDA